MQPSGNLLKTNRASIETLAVTIRALQVNKKQMTQAVFKQLPLGKLNMAGRHGKFDQELWGWVNYTANGQGPEWIVFSMNGCLFKTRPPALRYPYIVQEEFPELPQLFIAV